VKSELQAETTAPADSAKLFEESLHLLKKLFQQSGDHHWEERIDKSIENWNRIQSAYFFLHLYGGMGSIADDGRINLVLRGRDSLWAELAYQLLLDVAYDLGSIQQGLSKKSVQSILDHLSTSKKFRFDSFASRECKQCNARWISQEDIERKVCSLLLPKHFAEQFAEGELSRLFELDALINSSSVETIRSELWEAAQHDGFMIAPENASTEKCPKCASGDRTLTYFRFVNRNKEWRLQPQKFLFGCIGLLVSTFLVAFAFLCFLIVAT
jgi:hypothetical protein